MRLFKTEIQILQDIAYHGAYFWWVDEPGRLTRALNRLTDLHIIKERGFKVQDEDDMYVYTFL